MRVSVVTISFNQARYVERALRSVFEQDYDDVEYIVVDPGSTDGSRDIIERHRSSLAAYITDPDEGPADGLNRGFAHATGEILAYLNADDALLPGAVREAVDYLTRHPHADVVSGDGFIVDAEGRPIRRFRSTPFTVRRWARGGVTAMQQATFFRRSAFEDVGGFNAENRAIWDAELLLDFGLSGKRIDNVHRSWAIFTIHADSISGSKRASAEVRGRIQREQARLVERALGRTPGRLDKLQRARARIEKWLLDPLGFALRLGEAVGLRPALDPEQEVAARIDVRPVVPRVSLVSHAYIEPQVRKNAAALADLVDLQVVTPRRWEVLVFEAVELDGADVRAFFRPYTPLRLFGSQYLLPTLTMCFRRRRPDVIVVEYDPWNLIFWQTVACRRLFAPRARIVCHVKKNTYRPYRGLRGRVKRAIAEAGIRRVDRFMAATRMAAQLYTTHHGVEPRRIDVVPHLGVDVEAFATRARGSSDVVVVGYSGHFAAYKGVEDLVEAVRLARRDVAVELRLLGRGELAARLGALAAGESWLRLYPAVPNGEVPTFLAELDLFVMPTRVLPDHEEHDGLAVIEALAAGLPVVGTRSGAIIELLEDGSGVLVEPSDPPALAAAIKDLAADPARRSELSKRARDRAVAFDLDAVAARKAAVVEAVAA